MERRWLRLEPALHMVDSKTNLDLGHDVPLADRRVDDYNRWPLATAISALIESAPRGWATRIALYGRWGEGKTTVLNFVESQQRAKENVVIRFAPWGVNSETELWGTFAKSLRTQLANSGLNLGVLAGVQFWLRRHASFLPGILKGTSSAVEQATHIPVPASIVDATSKALTRLLSFGRQYAEKLAKYAANRRVVVLIDDLDRADPSLVPRLLLTLRELLDLPQFIFIVAFDREVITRALERYNTAWGPEGALFLEKIIDFPFELPNPTPKQVKKLAIRQFKNVCPFVPSSAIEDLFALFPDNPRRMKLFARIISSLEKEAKRHEERELNWTVILLYHLIDLEDPKFAKAFFERILDDKEFSWTNWLFSSEINKEEQKKVDDFIDVAHKHLPDGVKTRLHALVNAWKERSGHIVGVVLDYQLSFAMNPHHITWGEFKPFLAKWREERSTRVIRTFIQKRADAIGSTIDSAATELMESILGHYGNVLELASNTRSSQEWNGQYRSPKKHQRLPGPAP